MAVDTDIVVSGGGLIGTALALAAAHSGLSVALIDPSQPDVRMSDEFDGRSYALSLSSQRLLAAIGLWQGLAEKAQPILDITVSDGRPETGPSPLFLHFDHAEIEEGPMGFMIEDRYLRRVLLSALETTEGISSLFGQTAAGHTATAGAVEVTTDQGTVLRAGLLVAADGVRSPTARRSGLTHLSWRYGQTSLVCALAHEADNSGHAYQYFLPSGPLAILPLPDNRCSVVWTESTDTATKIQDMSDANYLDVLRPRFGDFLGDISLSGARFSYPLGLSLARSFVTDRLALVGDAAHRIHPIAGQGLNAGFKDIAALVEVVALAARRGDDIGRSDVLERYQRWRRFDVVALAAATDGFNRLFSNDIGVVRLARDLGLATVGALPGLRRGIIREAAGLTGDLPLLLQGRQI
ncbi:MAG: FAD-dependent monooxygenase [Pseudomonadota bacterium]